MTSYHHMVQRNETSSHRLTANALKEIVVSFLLQRDSDGAIGSEVMYGSSRRVADIVFISKGHSYAIEIKSKYDTIARLEGQLLDYQTLFDYILVFSAPNHIQAISNVAPSFVGLYSISEDGIQMIRRERLNHQVKKNEMLLSIPSAIVKTDFSVKGKLSSDEIRSVVIKKSYKTIHDYFIDYCKSRFNTEGSHIIMETQSQEQENSSDYIII